MWINELCFYPDAALAVDWALNVNSQLIRLFPSVFFFLGIFLKTAAILQLHITTISVILSLYYSRNFNTKIISRGGSFQNDTHLKLSKMRPKTDIMGEGHKEKHVPQGQGKG